MAAEKVQKWVPDDKKSELFLVDQKKTKMDHSISPNPLDNRVRFFIFFSFTKRVFRFHIVLDFKKIFQ